MSKAKGAPLFCPYEEISNALYEDAGSLVISEGINGPQFEVTDLVIFYQGDSQNPFILQGLAAHCLKIGHSTHPQLPQTPLF